MSCMAGGREPVMWAQLMSEHCLAAALLNGEGGAAATPEHTANIQSHSQMS
jgi:hypothetical protein